jgi:hypothetical protein
MEICSGTNLIQPVTVALATSTARYYETTIFVIFALDDKKPSVYTNSDVEPVRIYAY